MRVTDIPAMLATAAGRTLILEGVFFRLWPLLSRVGRLHRRTLARRTRVVAVVGSIGKTTTTRAVWAALGASGRWTSGRNSWSGVAWRVLRIRPWTRHAIIEVGIDGPGQMGLYARVVQPDVTVVTAVASEHHRSLRSLETTRDEKSHMVRALTPSGTAVLNGDDARVMWMAGVTGAGRVVTYGFGDLCDIRADEVRLDWPHGTRFRLRAFGHTRELRVRLIGRPMIYPVLAAIAVAHVEGLDLDQAIARVSAMAPSPGRLEPVALPNGAIVLRDDFKSSFETFEAALDVFSGIPAARRIAVVGDVSEPPGPQGPLYGALAARLAEVASHLIVLGGCFERYATGARRAGFPKSALIDAGHSPARAAEALRTLLQPGDVVLLKGRDTQKLDRVRLIVQGRPVQCDIRFCKMKVGCEICPMLERGWQGRRPVMPT